MAKPHYPAHVFHQLIKYPRLVCEECGAVIMPRLNQPNKGNRRVHLESISGFRRKRYCSHACANRASQRRRRQAERGALEDHEKRAPNAVPMTREAPPSEGHAEAAATAISIDDGLPAPADAMTATERARAGRHLDPATRRLLRNALEHHNEPGSALIDMFPAAPKGGKA